VKTRIAKWTNAAGAVAVLTLVAGCASVDDMNSLRGGMESLRGEIMAAQAAANAAAAEAEAARTEAGEASRTANRALSAAREAQTCCADNREKSGRMFKKPMIK